MIGTSGHLNIKNRVINFKLGRMIQATVRYNYESQATDSQSAKKN